MYNFIPSLPSRDRLPTMYELPSEDPEEPGLPDTFHPAQSQLLQDTFQTDVVPMENTFIGMDLNLYYDSRNPRWHKRPDWFVSLGVASSGLQEDMRWSYVIWEESVSPFLVVELLSPGTEDEDLGNTLRMVDKPPTKWQVYEQILRVPYYVIFDRYVNQLRVFKLMGLRYEEMVISEERFWLEEIGLGVGVWEGVYQGTFGKWLRWYDDKNIWVPTPQEASKSARLLAESARSRAESERNRAESERNRAESERSRAEQAETELESERSRAEQAEFELEQERLRSLKLLEKLRSLGIEPES
jgi:Uma2 family endonuclease